MNSELTRCTTIKEIRKANLNKIIASSSCYLQASVHALPYLKSSFLSLSISE